MKQRKQRTERLALLGSRSACVLALLLGAWVVGTSPLLAWAQELAEPAPPLELPLLDGVEEPPEDAAEPEATPPEEPPAAPDSIEAIAQQMQQVESRLRSADAGETTQTMQRQIVDALEEYIEQLRNSQGEESSPSQGAGGQPQENPQAGEQEEPQEQEEPSGSDSPPENQDENAQENEDAEESVERAGHRPGEDAEAQLSRADLLREAWGHLPGRAGHEMPNAATERFLPEFERQIEEYFRRLAEEPPADAL